MHFTVDHRPSASLVPWACKRIGLRTRSEKAGKGNSSSGRFLSQVIESLDFGAEYNIQLAVPSKGAEQRREMILTVRSWLI